jgi:hypothetical protein
MNENELRQVYRRGSLATILSGVLLIVAALLFTSGCGASNVSMTRVVSAATRTACGQLQERAVVASGSRAEAQDEVSNIQSRCDIAYSGIETAGLLLEEVRDGE